MKPEILKENAERIIMIIKDLNGIKKLIYEYGIDSPESLFAERDVLDALCHKAFRIYELYLASFFHNNQKYSRHRAKLAHISKRLRGDGLNGFDDVNPEELWDENFVNAIPQIREEVNNKIEKISDLKEAVDELSSSEVRPPIKLLEVSDFSHVRIIRDISNNINDHTVCAVGLLNMMSIDSIPPTVSELFVFSREIIGCDQEQFDFVITELVKKDILSISSGEDYLFINDKVFGINATRDLLDNFDVDQIVEILKKENE